MNSLDEFLDRVDQWKFKAHEKLKRMTPRQRKALWQQVHDEARARGLKVVEADDEPMPAKKRPRKTPSGGSGDLLRRNIGSDRRFRGVKLERGL